MRNLFRLMPWMVCAAAGASFAQDPSALLNLPTLVDCTEANKSALVIGIVVGIVAGLLAAGAIKLLEVRMILRNDVARLSLGALLGAAVALGIDFAATRGDDIVQQCLGDVGLCRVMALCGKAQALRSGLVAALPAVVVTVVVTLLRGFLGRRR